MEIQYVLNQSFDIIEKKKKGKIILRIKLIILHLFEETIISIDLNTFRTFERKYTRFISQTILS